MKAFVTLLIASFSGIANCHAIIPDTVYIRKPESMRLIYRNLEVITNDGYKIETWFFPAQNPPSESEDVYKRQACSFTMITFVKPNFFSDAGTSRTPAPCIGE